jgi:glycosyltransferase involved in cell wall biosynthesis
VSADGAGLREEDTHVRIRIAYLIWNLKPAGAELQLLELVRRLDSSRFEPHVVVFKKGSLNEQFPCPVWNVAPRNGWGGRGAATGLRGFMRLLRVLRVIRPQILHSFLPEITQVYGAVAALLLRIPAFVCSRRAAIGLYPRGALMRTAEWLTLRLTDRLAVNAVWLRDEAAREFPSNRIVLIPNGVDTHRFRPGLVSRTKEFGWPEGGVVIGMVANFRSCKRHEDFLQAAARVRVTHPQARFLLVGRDTGSLGSVRRTILKLELDEVVCVVTDCSHPEEYYGSMHVVACTSETEGLSNALLEAEACGLPIVATSVGGNPEVVRDGREGILVSAHDPDAVAGAIRRLIDDPALRRTMGEAGLRRAEEQFSMAGMVRGYESLYGNLLGAREMESEVRGTAEPA